MVAGYGWWLDALFCWREMGGPGAGGGILGGRGNIDMPTTQHSAAAERHMQAAHAHEAAAASHSQNDHMGAHEQSRLAMEHAREAHRLSEELAKELEKR